MLLTLRGSVAFKRKALEQSKNSPNFNLNLPHWLGKLSNVIIRVYVLHPSGRHEGAHTALLTGLLQLANEMETFGKVRSIERFVISRWGCRNAWKQVVGLRGTSNRESKAKCQHSSAGVAKFYGCQLLYGSPTFCEKWPSFLHSQDQLNFSKEKPTFN